jgi:hypothetical protein
VDRRDATLAQEPAAEVGLFLPGVDATPDDHHGAGRLAAAGRDVERHHVAFTFPAFERHFDTKDRMIVERSRSCESQAGVVVGGHLGRMQRRWVPADKRELVRLPPGPPRCGAIALGFEPFGVRGKVMGWSEPGLRPWLGIQ